MLLNRKADLAYPLYPASLHLIERIALRRKSIPGFCPICGHFTKMIEWGSNLRETGLCENCHSINRHRQIAYVLCASLNEWHGTIYHSINSNKQLSELSIYHTQTTGPIHDYLSRYEGYVCSEYFGEEYSPGELVNGLRHEDLTGLSFPSETFDIILSSEVFEHIPKPYSAHEEVFRVLKPGGRHIFTVPFHQTLFSDDIRAVSAEGEPNFLKPPIYHFDPLRPEGVLVYTIFSIQMLSELENIGFRTHMYLLYHPTLGILGANGLVFEAIKE